MSHATVQLLPQLEGTEVLRSSYREHRFATHCHDTFVVQRIEAGADWCPVVGRAARAGEAWVHFPFAVHSGGTLDGQTLRSTALYPARSLVAALTGTRSTELPVGISFVLTERRALRLLQQVLDAEPTGRKADQVAQELFLRVLDAGDGAASGGGAAESSPLVQAVERAVDYLQAHSTRDVSIAEVASTCQLSPSHLIRTFKKQLGITPHQFLISQRVAHARRLLHSGMTPAETALTAGFSDQSHLNRCFKRITGSTPGACRRAASRARNSVQEDR